LGLSALSGDNLSAWLVELPKSQEIALAVAGAGGSVRRLWEAKTKTGISAELRHLNVKHKAG
jgi:hypothetical protein